MEHLKNLFEGARQVLVLDTDSQYLLPSRNGFSKDMSSLRGDARNIASDLRKVTNIYGEQAYNSTGK
jgi:CO dehydrogenase nickel-insertion accessory protein CooC1